jgi:superfamily II DNA/RNA helicase
VTALLSDARMPDSFEEFGLPPELLQSLAASGIDRPFPIQSATLPDALAGRDILGRAKTGSGKTLGFSIPMVTRLSSDGMRTKPGRPRGLVLVPTRELASQVERVLRPLAESLGLRVTTVFGGVSMRPQMAAMRRATDIVVACPGRLADLIDRGHCDLGDVDVTVLDEADHMADLGFLPVVRRLLSTTPESGQRLLFSATLDSAVDVLARRFLHDPARHSVDNPEPPASMTHYLLTVSPADRVDVLVRLAGGDNRSLIFTRTKHGAKRLARQLEQAGIPAAQLHGDLTQGARERNLAAFASGEVRVLTATDIAARGIHVDGVGLVIHADPPSEHKAYLHRSGRTARGGADGTVITVQVPPQAAEVKRLMHKAGVTPIAATVTPSSPQLAELAGPEAPRVEPVRKPASSPAASPARESAPRVSRSSRSSRASSRASRTGDSSWSPRSPYSSRSPREDTERRPSRTEDAERRPPRRGRRGSDSPAPHETRAPRDGAHDGPRGGKRAPKRDEQGPSGRRAPRGDANASGRTTSGRGASDRAPSGLADSGRAASSRTASGRASSGRNADGRSGSSRTGGGAASGSWGRQARSGRPAGAGRTRQTEFRGRGA